MTNGFRGLLAGLLGIALSSGVLASETLARIGAQIQQYPLLRAEFVQTKQVAAMKRPLVTSGHLTFSQQHGVLWQIEQPYRMSYVLGEERIVEISSDGVRRERGLREVPGLAQVGRVFRAMLGANTAALQEVFEVAVQGDVGKWEISLKPRQAQLAQFLSGMQLSGARFVESITISEAGGDTTQIRFRNTQGLTAPSESELQLFGAKVAGAAKP
ncbi:MAG: outer membrane lipoprotein carrier protein LolA [Betaproteobacteria bacterium]